MNQNKLDVIIESLHQIELQLETLIAYLTEPEKENNNKIENTDSQVDNMIFFNKDKTYSIN